MSHGDWDNPVGVLAPDDAGRTPQYAVWLGRYVWGGGTVWGLGQGQISALHLGEWRARSKLRLWGSGYVNPATPPLVDRVLFPP